MKVINKKYFEFKKIIFVKFFLIFGLLNAIIASNTLRIFTSYSSDFGNDYLILLPFYVFILLLSVLLLNIILFFKVNDFVFKLLTLIYFTTFITPNFISSGYTALLETVFLYSIVMLAFCLIELKFRKKDFYPNIFLKVVIIIAISTPLVDSYYLFKYFKKSVIGVQASEETISSDVVFLNDKIDQIDNIFYIVFDKVSPKSLLIEAELGEDLFFKKTNDGIYFNNAWTNGHRTAVSLNQHLNGYFSEMSKPFLHHELKSKGIHSNYFLYNRFCTKRYSLSCYGLTELINYEENSFLNYFYLSKMIHALELRFNLPIFRALNLFSSNKHFADFEKTSESKKSYDLINLQLNKLDNKFFSGMKNTYNFIYFYPPHHPYVYDKSCSLISDPTVISLDLSVDGMDHKAYLNQISCMNKTILKFIKMLKKKKLYNSSLIIITTDHSIGFADIAMNEKKGVNKITFENLAKIKKHQDLFNSTVNLRGHIPLWIKPAYHDRGLVYNDKMILSLDLPVTTLGAFNIRKPSLPGLDIFDTSINDNTFNNRIKSMIMYGQYKQFRPFTYLLETENNWSVVQEKNIKNIEENKFIIRK